MKLPKTPKLGATLGSTLGTTLGTPAASAPKDITKIGKQGVAAKMPKPKAPRDAFAPPSVFFGKSEDKPKHLSVCKLKDFIEHKMKKRAQK